MDFPTKISFSECRDERNVLLFDAGLHTLGLRKSKDEKDNEFVTRFLIQFLEGCKERDPDAKGFFICHQEGAAYLSVGKVMSEDETRRQNDMDLEEKIQVIVNQTLERKFEKDPYD